MQASIFRKQDELLENIADVMGRGVSTIHRWLPKMKREGLERRHDDKSPDRPRLLSPEQERTVEADLTGPPRECGFGRGSWNVRCSPDAYWNVWRAVQPEVGPEAGPPARVFV